ncbi:MAG: TRAP transporter small permease [Candidatus Accumulibacter sp.]|nr:TRAP transporter small permease [Accumulibacter sp.]MCB1966609.1 TRAP transporter small permease [Accumulibacter sp.]
MAQELADNGVAAGLLPAGPPAPLPIRWLGRAVDWSVVLIGATMAALIFSNVIVHNVFDGDIAWTTEFCELLMVWVTFLGGASATRRGAHMVIGELLDRLAPAPRQLADAAIQVVVLITLGLLVWYGIGIADAGRLSVLTVLGWPMATQYAALPVASSITMVFVAWDLVEILRGRPREERYGGERP